MMDEKEIAGLIEMAIATVLFSDDPAEWDWPKAAKQVAHAIAEGMKEGVVAEQRYIIRHADYPDPAAAHMICSYLTMFGDTGHGHEGEYIWLGNKRIGKDGKTYRVTVRLEGEDADKGMG